MNVGLHSTVSGDSITASQPSSWCALRALCLQNACEQMPHLSPLKWFRRSWMFLNLKFERRSHNYTHPWQSKKFWHKSKWTNYFSWQMLHWRFSVPALHSCSSKAVRDEKSRQQSVQSNIISTIFGGDIFSSRSDSMPFSFSIWQIHYYVSAANDTKSVTYQIFPRVCAELISHSARISNTCPIYPNKPCTHLAAAFVWYIWLSIDSTPSTFVQSNFRHP